MSHRRRYHSDFGLRQHHVEEPFASTNVNGFRSKVDGPPGQHQVAIENYADDIGLIIENIAHHRKPSPYVPHLNLVDFNGINEQYQEKTRNKFTRIDQTLLNVSQPSQPQPMTFRRAEGAGNLLTSFHAIASAERLFLCTGTNCADAKPQLDGPIATALLAYALYQVHKAPTILADRANLGLLRQLLNKLDPDLAEHVRYVEVNAVNGMLVNAMHRLINVHKPQVILHIGVPGRAGDGLHYDADGNFIGEYNMAIDQVMNLANALGTQTIALGHSVTQAGMNGISAFTIDVEKHSGLRAGNQIPAASATSSALALGSLLMAAYKDAELCEPNKLDDMIRAGREAQETDRFLASLVARPGTMRPLKPIYNKDASAVRGNEHERLRRAASHFPSLQTLLREERMPWPQFIEEQQLYGPKQRYISAVDSSDGVLVAAKRFWNVVRARSPYVLSMLLVADHKHAPYGPRGDEYRNRHVHSMLRYTASQGKEVVIIVMMCNTACLEDLDEMKRRISEELNSEAREKGGEPEEREIVIHIIDLIEYTSKAIAERGGHKVVLLSTEATASKEKYPEQIRKAAVNAGKSSPTVIRIGCGNEHDPTLKDKDWATLVNKGYYLEALKDPDGPIATMLKDEIDRYVDQIPLDSTSVWLCCTHFPALKQLIEARLAKRLRKAGLTHSIPVFDPMEDQAEALIRKLQELEKEDRPDYSQLPRFSIHTTGSDIEVKMSAIRHGLTEAVVQTVSFDADAHGKKERHDARQAKEAARRPKKPALSEPASAAS
jgi:glutamate racemase